MPSSIVPIAVIWLIKIQGFDLWSALGREVVHALSAWWRPGGKQWIAESGMDHKSLRIFNPYTQAATFDPFASYIHRWLSELAHV